MSLDLRARLSTSRPKRPAPTVAVVVAGALLSLGVAGLPAASEAAGSTTLYLVQGLPGKTVDVSIDGKQVARSLDGADVKGPFEVAAGAHRVSVAVQGGETIDRTVNLRSGSSTDAVVHLPAESGGDPMITTYTNDLAAVPADKATLQVAHTAAVPPADVVVDGKVLFENIANGESLNLTVPAGTYTVKIVPTGKKGPAILGPVELGVKSRSLNAVYAFGDPDTKSMNVAVHTVTVGTAGSKRPEDVDTGTGGQAAGFRPSPWSQLLTGSR